MNPPCSGCPRLTSVWIMHQIHASTTASLTVRRLKRISARTVCNHLRKHNNIPIRSSIRQILLQRYRPA